MFWATVASVGWYYVINAIYEPGVVEFPSAAYAAAIFAALYVFHAIHFGGWLGIYLCAGSISVVGITLLMNDAYTYKAARNGIAVLQYLGIICAWTTWTR